MRLIMALVLGISASSPLWAKAPITPIQNNTFFYIAQPASAATGLLILGGYRLYDARQGTFTKQDSWSPFRALYTRNGFDYAAGNPVLLSDQSGHIPVTSWLDLLDPEEGFAVFILQEAEDAVVEAPVTPRTYSVQGMTYQQDIVIRDNTTGEQRLLNSRRGMRPLHINTQILHPVPAMEPTTPPTFSLTNMEMNRSGDITLYRSNNTSTTLRDAA